MGAASSRDHTMYSNKATFFRGWKPLPREIDVNLMALTSDLLKYHKREEQGAQELKPDTSYETTPKWHSSMMIRLPVSMAWIKQRTAENQMTSDEWWMMGSLREIFFKTDRIHSFDVRCWMFDVGRSLVYFSIWPAVFLVGGWAEHWHLKPGESGLNHQQSRFTLTW